MLTRTQIGNFWDGLRTKNIEQMMSFYAPGFVDYQKQKPSSDPVKYRPDPAKRKRSGKQDFYICSLCVDKTSFCGYAFSIEWLILRFRSTLNGHDGFYGIL